MAFTYDSITPLVIPIGSEATITGSDFIFGSAQGYSPYSEMLWYGAGEVLPVLTTSTAYPLIYNSSAITTSNALVTSSDKFSAEDQTFVTTPWGSGFGHDGSPAGAVSVFFGYEDLPSTRETIVESAGVLLDKANISYDPISDSLKLVYGSVVLEMLDVGIEAGKWYQVTYSGYPGNSGTPRGLRLTLAVDGIRREEFDPSYLGLDFVNIPPVYGRGTEGPLQVDGFNYFSGHMRNYYQGVFGTIPWRMNDNNPRTYPDLYKSGAFTSLEEDITYIDNDTMLFTMPDIPLGVYRVYLDRNNLNGGITTAPSYIEIEVVEAVVPPVPPIEPPIEPPAYVPPRTTEEYFKSSQSSSLAIPLTVNFDKIEKILNDEILTKYDLVNETNQMEEDFNLGSLTIDVVGKPSKTSSPISINFLQQSIKNKIVVEKEVQLGSDIVGGNSTLLELDYVLGDNSLSVYAEGVRMYEGRDYTEVSATEVLWIVVPAATDTIEFYTTEIL